MYLLSVSSNITDRRFKIWTCIVRLDGVLSSSSVGAIAVDYLGMGSIVGA